MQKKEILISPAHYFLDEKTSGSELSWVAHILRGLIHSKQYYLHILTGYVKSFELKGDDGVIHEIYRSSDNNQTVFQSLFFTVKKTITSIGILNKRPIKVVHHMLPFLLDTTFDLDFIFRSRTRRYILGPIQSPQQVFSNEEFNFPAAKDFSISFWQQQLAYINYFFTTLFKQFTRSLCLATLRAADVIIVINDHTKQLLLDRGISPAKIRVIPPGIDTRHFSAKEAKSTESTTLQLIAVGYLIKRKGFDYILQALAELRDKKVDAHLTLVGDGPQMQALKDMAAELKVSQMITFAGYTPHLKTLSYYRAADLCINMSKSESWGQMYLEAMACGLPIVTAEQPGSLSIVKEGVFGYFVKQGDYKTLADRITELSKDRKKLIEMGKKARQETEVVYDWERVIIPQYERLYADLLK